MTLIHDIVAAFSVDAFNVEQIGISDGAGVRPDVISGLRHVYLNNRALAYFVEHSRGKINPCMMFLKGVVERELSGLEKQLVQFAISPDSPVSNFVEKERSYLAEHWKYS